MIGKISEGIARVVFQLQAAGSEVTEFHVTFSIAAQLASGTDDELIGECNIVDPVCATNVIVDIVAGDIDASQSHTNVWLELGSDTVEVDQYVSHRRKSGKDHLRHRR